MRYDAFINYNTDDYSSVNLIVQRLRQEGYSVWFDRDALPAGASVIREIEQGLRSSETILVCIKSSEMSNWQNSELDIALQISIENPAKRVIPLLLPGTPEAVELSLFLRRFSWINFRQGWNQEDQWDKLFRSISRPDNLRAS